ncbi:MAG: DUF1987 domain-containing protein [Cytophagaceae bacterium]|jgi:hypothetical protein|nr:DUF1987 domain-containing protein [Cytophagaceae bacterium]
MDTLVIEGTQKTPYIYLDANGMIEIRGSSYPENCRGFYKPVLSWVSEYSQSPAQRTQVNFYFKYFNTSTSGIVMDILSSLKKCSKPVQVTWTYDDGDEETLLSGQNFSELLEMKFEYTVK